MTERAEALISNPRFCEWLDATAAHASGWPHNRIAAMDWLLEECGIDALSSLRVDPEAAAAYEQIERRFEAWDKNGELEL